MRNILTSRDQWQTLNTDENIRRKFDFDSYIECRDATAEEFFNRIALEEVLIHGASELKRPDVWCTWDIDQGISFRDDSASSGSGSNTNVASVPNGNRASNSSVASSRKRSSTSAFMVEFSRSLSSQLRLKSNEEDGLDWDHDENTPLDDSIGAGSMSSLSFGRSNSQVDEVASLQNTPPSTPAAPMERALDRLIDRIDRVNKERGSLDRHVPAERHMSMPTTRRRSASPSVIHLKSTSIADPVPEDSIRYEGLGEGFANTPIPWINPIVEGMSRSRDEMVT